ncbi:MAG: NAD(P)H-binding protein [Methylobacteriaceae bacterium]|nr:NAD(P)H-binding protein [Methylobacteriaceae bacterium]
MTIAVTGASGQLGRLVIAAIKRRAPAARLVALVRSPDKAGDLGVELRRADYDDAEGLRAALVGIDALLLISSNEIGKRARQHANVIAAARAAGVKRVVYTSLLRADSSPLSLAPEHAETESTLKASGLSFTILRNGWYAENHTGSIPGALAGGAFVGAAGEGRIAAAARADYAEAAAVALLDEAHAGKTYELAGDSAFTLAELAAELSRQSGKTIPYRNLPEADYAAALAGFGLPEAFAKAIASWDVAAARGALFDEGRQLSRLIDRPTTPLARSVAAVLT